VYSTLYNVYWYSTCGIRSTVGENSKLDFQTLRGWRTGLHSLVLGTPSGNVNFVHWDLLSKIRIKMKNMR